MRKTGGIARQKKQKQTSNAKGSTSVEKILFLPGKKAPTAIRKRWHQPRPYRKRSRTQSRKVPKSMTQAESSQCPPLV